MISIFHLVRTTFMTALTKHHVIENQKYNWLILMQIAQIKLSQHVWNDIIYYRWSKTSRKKYRPESETILYIWNSEFRWAKTVTTQHQIYFVYWPRHIMRKKSIQLRKDSNKLSSSYIAVLRETLSWVRVNTEYHLSVARMITTGALWQESYIRPISIKNVSCIVENF